MTSCRHLAPGFPPRLISRSLRGAIVLLIATIFALLPSPAAAQRFGDTQCASSTRAGTPDDDLATPPGRGFSLPQVKVTRKRLIVTPARGGQNASAELDCKLENTGSTDLKFLFCAMISPPGGVIAPRPTCELVKTGNRLECVRTANQDGREGIHFGCEEVEINAGESKSFRMGPVQDAYLNDKKATDFQVNYADIVDMHGADGKTGEEHDADDLTYAAATCNPWLGANTFLNTTPVGAAIGGIWAMWHQPWIDPYQWHQPFGGEPGTQEFFPYEDAFSLPSEFPIDVGDLPRSPPGGKPLPLGFPVDVHLFDWFTMGFAENETPAFYEIQHDGTGGFATDPPPGVRLPVNLPAGGELYATATVLTPEVCPEEGTTLELRVVTSDARTGEPIIWQRGKVINDTVPPVGLTHVAKPGAGTVRFEVTAVDDTTLPLAATLWFSADGGRSWANETMVEVEDPAHPLPGAGPVTVRFVQDLPAVPEATLLYFFTVQDEVFNLLWYGPGTVELPGRTGCSPDEETLCLAGGRFEVRLDWRTQFGTSGPGRVAPCDSDDSGLLYFFDPDNWEMLVKVLNGCRINDHFWVFSSATTNVELDLRVTDTQTGEVRRYQNPLGRAAPSIQDTSAFATCP